jgi:hypothetical protein
MKHATELFVTEYAESIGLKTPFKRTPSFGELFRAVFPEDAMDATEKSAFRRLIPYFFGNFESDEFNPLLFAEAVKTLLQPTYCRLFPILARRAAALAATTP